MLGNSSLAFTERPIEHGAEFVLQAQSARSRTDEQHCCCTERIGTEHSIAWRGAARGCTLCVCGARKRDSSDSAASFWMWCSKLNGGRRPPMPTDWALTTQLSSHNFQTLYKLKHTLHASKHNYLACYLGMLMFIEFLLCLMLWILNRVQGGSSRRICYWILSL